MMRELLKCSEGSTLPLFAVSLLPIVVAAGGVVDYSRASQTRAALQAALDSAALAGAIDSTSPDEATRQARVRQHFAANFPMSPAPTPTVTISGNTVTVTATTSVNMAVVKAIGIDSVNVGGRATATRMQADPICMLALNSSSASSISLQGTAKLVASGCAIHANSSHASAISSGGASSASATGFCAVGSYSGNNFTPTPRSGCSVMPDPLANLPVPSNLACTHNNAQYSNGTYTISPGVYCGGLTFATHANVTLQPGLYVIRDGALTMRAHSNVTGTGVTFYLYGSNTYVEMRSHSNVNISAPTSGAYKGVAFTQHAASSPGLTNSLNGGAGIRIVGAMHFPTQVIDIGGASGMGATSPYMAMIADRFVLRGNGQLNLSADHTTAGFDDSLARVVRAARLTH